MYNTPILTENDIRSFLKEPPQTGAVLRKGFLYVAGFVGITALTYVLLNLQSLLFLHSASAIQAAPPTPKATAQAIVPTPTPTPTPEVPDIPLNTISIANLGISAPITWDVALDATTEEKILPNSTIHLAGTSHPGQQGVVFISGHSSNYPWIPGAYNSIFAPLVKAAVGQEIEINYQDHLYRYEITKTYQVSPTHIEVLESNGEPGLLRLSTCTPVGTDLNRLIVEAKQVYPDPSKNTPFQGVHFSGQIPSAR